MNKKKMVINYVPDKKEITPQQLEQYEQKESELFKYIMDNLLTKEVSSL